MALLDDLETEVRANTDVDASATLLLSRLATLLQDAKNSNDPARMQAIIDSLKNNNARLATAITDNTPAVQNPLNQQSPQNPPGVVNPPVTLPPNTPVVANAPRA